MIALSNFALRHKGMLADCILDLVTKFLINYTEMFLLINSLSVLNC